MLTLTRSYEVAICLRDLRFFASCRGISPLQTYADVLGPAATGEAHWEETCLGASLPTLKIRGPLTLSLQSPFQQPGKT